MARAKSDTTVSAMKFMRRSPSSVVYPALSDSAASSSVSLSLKMSRVARLALTRRCMLPRMSATARWYCLNPPSSSASFTRKSASVTRAMRIASLPCRSACSASRKVLVSLPRRKATSGSTTSPASMVLAFFAMRCVSMTSCAVTAFWRTEPPVWTDSAAISSASSSSAGLLTLIWRTASPSCTRFFSSVITRPALRSVFFHSRSRSCTRCCTLAGEAGTSTPEAMPPARSSFTEAANSSRLSRSCLKASRLPCEACCAALARRCDSMRIFPTVAT